MHVVLLYAQSEPTVHGRSPLLGHDISGALLKSDGFGGVAKSSDWAMSGGADIMAISSVVMLGAPTMSAGTIGSMSRVIAPPSLPLALTAVTLEPQPASHITIATTVTRALFIRAYCTGRLRKRKTGPPVTDGNG